MSKLIYEQKSYKIIGACIEVHKELGSGFLEGVYQEALEMEFENLGIPFEREVGFLFNFGEKNLKHKRFVL